MSRRLKFGAKSEIENMCVVFWCLTPARQRHIHLSLLEFALLRSVHETKLNKYSCCLKISAVHPWTLWSLCLHPQLMALMRQPNKIWWTTLLAFLRLFLCPQRKPACRSWVSRTLVFYLTLCQRYKQHPSHFPVGPQLPRFG
jgi:hypothetical protein